MSAFGLTTEDVMTQHLATWAYSGCVADLLSDLSMLSDTHTHMRAPGKRNGFSSMIVRSASHTCTSVEMFQQTHDVRHDVRQLYSSRQ